MIKLPIVLYNSKTKTKEKFVSLTPEQALIYTCGPTVYHYAHIGNMRAYVFADTLHRTLKMSGYKVKHVINITDVGHLTDDGDQGEDKLEKGSLRTGMSAWDVAKLYTEEFFRDLKSLNVNIEDYSFPRATAFIQEQISVVSILEKKGHTYTIDGDGVYFDVSTFAGYADFAKLILNNQQGGVRVAASHKRNDADFALWKFSPLDQKRQMEWESPWGVGFPGWHVECSAMSAALLGAAFDIHTGGIDHISVHHTNEIAQSQCAFGEVPHLWMHVAFLNENSGKMSKSNGEFVRIETLRHLGINVLSYRYYLLGASYRKEIEFSLELLKSASKAYEKIGEFMIGGSVAAAILESYYEEFVTCMNDDLNSSAALAIVHEMLNDKTKSDEMKRATLVLMDEYLGLDLQNFKRRETVIPAELIMIADARIEAKNNKNYELADSLRQKIFDRGYEIMDNGSEYTIRER